MADQDGFDDDEFEEQFEEFCRMTEEQVEAVLQREMAEYARWWDGLTPLRRYRIGRRGALRSCRNWRKLVRQGWCVELFTEYLRDGQKRLLKLRIERATGTYPGSA